MFDYFLSWFLFPFCFVFVKCAPVYDDDNDGDDDDNDEDDCRSSLRKVHSSHASHFSIVHDYETRSNNNNYVL